MILANLLTIEAQLMLGLVCECTSWYEHAWVGKWLNLSQRQIQEFVIGWRNFFKLIIFEQQTYFYIFSKNKTVI